jgi:hypothetical protein
MAKILLWNPKDGNIGHCWLELSDGLYVSFWPEGEYGVWQAYTNQTFPSKSSTYEADRKAEGLRDPDRTILIRGNLNNQDINSWWNKNSNSGYNVPNNCSKIVEKALEAGNLDTDEYDTKS